MCNRVKEFSINCFLRIRDDKVIFRDRLCAGLKKVEVKPAVQIAI